jgi:hypothetical protein
VGTGGPFLGGKERPERDADHPPSSSAKVENEEELYLLSPPGAFMVCSGAPLLFFIKVYELMYYVLCSLKYGHYLIEIKLGITVKTSYHIMVADMTEPLRKIHS